MRSMSRISHSDRLAWARPRPNQAAASPAVLPGCAAEPADCVTEIRVVTQLSESDTDDPGANWVIAVPEKRPEPNRIADTRD